MPLPARPLLPETAPFASEQIGLLNRVMAETSLEQRSWLSGFLAGYAAATATDAAGGEHAYGLSGSYSSRDWSSGATYREVGEGFDPQAGFLARSAYRFVSARLLRYVRFPRVEWFRELRPHISYREHFDLDGFAGCTIQQCSLDVERPRRNAVAARPGHALAPRGPETSRKRTT